MSSAYGRPRGMLTLETLGALVGDGTIETVIVAFSDHYGRLVGKRYDAELFVTDTAGHGTHGCNYLLTTDMEMQPVPGYTFANWERGYGDFRLVPDLDTLRVASWLEKTALVLCDLEDDGSGQVDRARAALDVAASGGRGARGGFHHRGGVRARVLPLSARATVRPRPRAIRVSSRPAGTWRTTTSSRARGPSSSRPPSAII